MEELRSIKALLMVQTTFDIKQRLGVTTEEASEEAGQLLAELLRRDNYGESSSDDKPGSTR